MPLSRTSRYAGRPAKGARVGTSSLRRTCQLRALYPQLESWSARNVTRVSPNSIAASSMPSFSPVPVSSVLAWASASAPSWHRKYCCLPWPGGHLHRMPHGDIAIEQLIAPLHHRPTATRVAAERALNARLEGGCQVRSPPTPSWMRMYCICVHWL